MNNENNENTVTTFTKNNSKDPQFLESIPSLIVFLENEISSRLNLAKESKICALNMLKKLGSTEDKYIRFKEIKKKNYKISLNLNLTLKGNKIETNLDKNRSLLSSIDILQKDIKKLNTNTNPHVSESLCYNFNKSIEQVHIEINNNSDVLKEFFHNKSQNLYNYTLSSKEYEVFQKINQQFHDFYTYKRQVTEITSELQKLQQLSTFEASVRLINSEQSIYLNHFYDSRGRIYSNSPIHPVQNKLTRLFIEYKKETLYDEEIIFRIKKSRYFKHLLRTAHEEFDNTFELYNLFRNSIVNARNDGESYKAEINLYVFLLVAINIGKIFKNQLLQKHKYLSSSLTLLDFFKIAHELLLFVHKYPEDFNENCILTSTRIVEFLNTDIMKELSSLEKLELIFYLSQYAKFIKTGKWDNFSLSFDATGSTFQCWALLLLLKSLNSASVLNLKGCVWTDIYTELIKLFKKTYSKTLKALKFKDFILSRENFKRSIMTTNYNVTKWRSKLYTTEQINYPKNLKYDQFKMFDEELLFLHDLFFNFIKNDVFKILYRHDKELFETDSKGIFIYTNKRLDFRYYKSPDKLTEYTIKCNDIR